MPTVFVVGSGAREHALCERLARESDVLCAPGNPGIAAVARCVDVPLHDTAAVAAVARASSVDLVIVGPEAPLVAGLSDALQAFGIPCLGPSRAAAEIEGSKAFAKDFMARHGVPTAGYRTFTHAAAAEDYIRRCARPVVVKASGLAAGKGVVVASSTDEAIAAARSMLRDGSLGAAGSRVLVEDRLEGQELSFHVVADGQRYAVLGGAQDHKRLGEGDTGPNTGGMGAYAPVEILTPGLLAVVCKQIVEPTLAGLAAEGRDFRGVLFVGLMVNRGVPTVLEYNARFGDPECAVLLAQLPGPLFPLLLGAARGSLPDVPLTPRGAAAAVVMAAAGYPSTPRTGDRILGLDAATPVPGVQVFHAGTRLDGGQTVTAGGRVLTITATRATLDDALVAAYAVIDQIHFDGAQFRRDIGKSSPGRP